ncbi:MAG TPA: class A beta-lactamase, partial [Allosphingosinicella sp.]|nr:class A beta-lactamase [Allosphingosinicella sp.]
MTVSRRQMIDGSSRFARGCALVGIASIGLATAALAQAQPGRSGSAAPSFPATVRGYSTTAPAIPAATAQEAAARRILEGQVRALGQAFSGDIGIAVRDVQSGWTTSYDGDTFFPQQSVSKFWVALTALDKADRGDLSLSRPVTLTRADMTLFHQPVAAQIGANGYTTTVESLMTRALQQSDNTCNDAVLWRAGGPEAVRAFLRNKGISGIRFGPGERLLQSEIAGIEWRQSYAYGGGFYTARNAVPAAVRRAAFERYIKDPMDGATPVGIVGALARLKRGELLSPESTRKLLSIMSNTKTGPQRLKGGLAPGWRLAHKTGTGQVLGGVQAGYNDIGVITGPDGRSYSVAVLIRKTTVPLPTRMALMQNVTRAAID